MRLQELFETTEEDRALISLSSAIYTKLEKYINTDLDYNTVFDVPKQQIIRIGKIGDMFDTPIAALDDITIEIQGGNPFIHRASDIPDEDEIVDPLSKQIMAVWEEDARTIVLNLERLSSPRMKTVITHELRHALDDVKSGLYGGGPGKKYHTPKKKEHRKNDPYSTTQYRAQPAEINARFVEVLDILAKRIPQWYNKIDASEIKSQLTTDFRNLLNKYEIADLFPEKTKSPDYKRLVKRAYDFMQKEMKHVEAGLEKAGTPKVATGSF